MEPRLAAFALTLLWAAPALSQGTNQLSSGDCSPILSNVVADTISVTGNCDAVRNATHLSVYAEGRSPTRPDDPFYSKFYQQYKLTSTSEPVRGAAHPLAMQIARDVARSFTPKIPPANRPDSYDVTLNITNDGKLQITEPAGTTATLRITRFENFKTLAAMDRAIAASSGMVSMVQRYVDPKLLELGPEVSNSRTTSVSNTARFDAMQSGVYRIIISSPGYKEYSEFVELGRDRRLRTLPSWGEPDESMEQRAPVSAAVTREINRQSKRAPSHPAGQGKLQPVSFPWKIRLERGGAAEVVVLPIKIQAPEITNVGFAALEREIERNLLEAIRKHQVNAVPLEEGSRAGYNDLRAKGEAIPGIQHADYVILTRVEVLKKR